MPGDFYNGIALSEACAKLVDDSGLPLKAIAAETGKPYSTLYRELDANDEGAKIGVDTLLLLIRACHMEGSRHGSWPPKTPPGPLAWLAAKCGFRCVPNAAEPDSGNVNDEMLDDFAALAEMQKAARDGCVHPAIIVELAAKAQVELEETVEQYRREWAKKQP